MIPVILAGIIGTVLVVTFWDEIVDWLNDFIPKVEKVFQDIAHGAVVLGEKIYNNMLAIKHKLYYQQNKEWMEQTTTRQVDESEVPAHIRNKIMSQRKDADLTAELAPMLLS